MKPGVIILGILLVVLLAAVAIVWLAAPRLESVAPADQATDIPAGSAIRLVFSRPMQTESVAGRLEVAPFRNGQVSAEGDEIVFTPDLPWQAGDTVTVSLERGAQAAGLFQLPLLRGQSWSFTIRRPQLVYLYPSDRAANIFLLDPASGETSQITDSQAGVVDFDIDARGQTLYFSASVGDSGSAVYRLDLTSTEAAPLSLLDCPQAKCSSPRISPQGDLLAYERTALPGLNAVDYPQIWLLPVTGQDGAGEETPAQSPTLVSDPQHQALYPQWSPDGRLTYYDSVKKTFVVLDPRSGASQEFSNQTGLSGSWSPDGQFYIVPEILDNLRLPATPDPATFPVVSSHLMRFNAQDSSRTDLTSAEDLEDTAPEFSPDGSLLAFARKYLTLERWTPGRQLWLMRPDGTEARPVSNEPYFNHFGFAWNPTGNQIAYVRFNQNAPTDPPEVWLVDLGIGLETQLVIGGYAPRWIP
jgi:TolB protein